MFFGDERHIDNIRYTYPFHWYTYRFRLVSFFPSGVRLFYERVRNSVTVYAMGELYPGGGTGFSAGRRRRTSSKFLTTSNYTRVLYLTGDWYFSVRSLRCQFEFCALLTLLGQLGSGSTFGTVFGTDSTVGRLSGRIGGYSVGCTPEICESVTLELALGLCQLL